MVAAALNESAIAGRMRCRSHSYGPSSRSGAYPIVGKIGFSTAKIRMSTSANQNEGIASITDDERGDAPVDDAARADGADHAEHHAEADPHHQRDEPE